MKEGVCAECGRPIVVNEIMQEAREHLQNVAPDKDIGFICGPCELLLIGGQKKTFN